MSTTLKEVYITRLSSILPNAPVTNEEMEARLGMIDGNASRARSIVLRNNGIRKRYYAMDADGNITHTNAQMAAAAVKALTGRGVEEKDLGLLAAGTSAPDQMLPPHASEVHGLLSHNLEVMSPSGACSAGMQAMKYAYMSVATGSTNAAACVASELISPLMRASNYEKETERYRQLEQDPIIGFEKEFLRWMLSDGAGAMLLEPKPRGECDLKIEWMVSRSFANELEACMYLGAEKDEDGSIISWKKFTPTEQVEQSLFTFKQDVKLLGKNIVTIGVKWLAEVMREKGLAASEVDFFMPHLSSNFFKSKVAEELTAQGIPVPEEKWFLNLSEVGNVGSASIYLMLHDLVKSGRLKKGNRILLMVPESARFSYAFALLTVA